jgi:exosortase A-associated hydrolase 2
VYLHPFAEEMNRSRRMAALAARALAAQGVAVLQIDLLGCGDSSGDFADARWDAWRADVALALDWLQARCGVRPGLWGLRLGALLALDCARRRDCARLLLWQPVHSGAHYLTQFLRLQLAADMLDQQQAARNGTAALRATLRNGAPLEVAGYQLAPALADALDVLDSKALAPACPTHWFDLAAESGRPLPPAAQAVLQAWRAQGSEVTAQVVAGPPFWGTAEVATSPALLAATVALFGGQDG